MALATPIIVTGVSVTGGVALVTTATVHGLVINQGFSLQGGTNRVCNLNNTVATVPTTTTFTFNLNTPDTSSTGGTVSPAKEIIILDTNSFQTTNTIVVRYLLWLTTTTPKPSSPNSPTSLWSGASGQENAAILAGTTVEILRTTTLSSTITKAQLEAAIQNDFTTTQAAFSAAPAPGIFYGVAYDGTGWSS